MRVPGQPRFLSLMAVVGLTLITNTTFASGSLSVPPGFEVRLFADDDLAHDIFSMTVNAQGEVVVSGPGYVRALIDEDGDGQADVYRTYSDSPATGAQGLYFAGNDLLCTGDGGLLRYRDRDGDGQADGPAEEILALKTGGEHFAHAVARGPDGWWYVLLGNFAGIDHRHVSLPSSPIQQPQAGVLLRLRPDFSGSEIVADGFRNPYDFAFHGSGDCFTFDSDGERDVSLPWYRPTRLFQILPGAHAGWVTRNWKRPAYFADMPPVIVRCGRGSPTGIVAYRHHQFPDRYQGALFLLDWTFGRVYAATLSQATAVMQGRVETFLTATGQFGFAPTDATITPEGDLMICVGGRGTRGGVYRVRYVGGEGTDTSAGTSSATRSPATDSLTRCLSAPQPLSSWSRARWEPLANALGKEQLEAAATDTQRPVDQRIRAVEIITQRFGGLGTHALEQLRQDHSAAVRARVAWALEQRPWNCAENRIIQHLLDDHRPRVVRHALEATLRRAATSGSDLLLPALQRHLEAADRDVSRAAWKVFGRLPPHQQRWIAQDLPRHSQRASVGYALAITERRSDCDLPAFELAWNMVLAVEDPQLRLRAVRAAQQALGDMRGDDSLPDVYDGYANQQDLSAARLLLDDPAATDLLPTGYRQLDLELTRLFALLAPANQELAEKVARQLQETSHPVDDLHYLIVLSRLEIPPTPVLHHHLADALVQLESKMDEHQLSRDRNWDLRVGEMYRQLIHRAPQLGELVIDHPQFGEPGHVIFALDAGTELQGRAARRVAAHLEHHPETVWTSRVVLLLGQSPEQKHRKMVREQFEDLALRGAVIKALARHPDEGDRPLFHAGLQSPDLAVLQAAVGALEQLEPNQDADEQFMLLAVARQLGADRQEQLVRDRAMRLLRRNLGQDFGYRFDLPAKSGQTDVLQRWTAHLKQRFPEIARQRLQSAEKQAAQLQTQLASVDWNAGDTTRGAVLFEKQSCQSCHSSRAAVGPDLAGIGTRFSRDDLFAAIIYPNQDVSPRYNTTLIETTRGKVLSGLVIYESVDGLTLLDSTNQTIRVEAEEIYARHELSNSLMPAGLLDSLAPQDLADLYAYMRGL